MKHFFKLIDKVLNFLSYLSYNAMDKNYYLRRKNGWLY